MLQNERTGFSGTHSQRISVADGGSAQWRGGRIGVEVVEATDEAGKLARIWRKVGDTAHGLKGVVAETRWRRISAKY